MTRAKFHDYNDIFLFCSNFFQITTVKEVIDGTLPFFREKPRDVALSEGEPLELKCLVASEPKSAIHWLKNDLIFMDDSRLRVNTTEDGASTLTLDPAMPSDTRGCRQQHWGQNSSSASQAWWTPVSTEVSSPDSEPL